MNLSRFLIAVVFGFAVAVMALIAPAIERILKPQE